jgi:hypothetical protein
MPMVLGSLTDEAAMNPKRTRILAPVAAFFGALNMHAQPPSGGSVPFLREMPGVFGPVTARIKAGDRAPDISFTKVLQPAGALLNFTERLRTQLNFVVTPAQRDVEMLVFTPQ